MENRKNKHLTLEDRNTIQQCLDHGMTFKAIAAQIGKDQTTVSKEVKKHLEFTASRVVYRDKNGALLPSLVYPKLLKTHFVCTHGLRRFIGYNAAATDRDRRKH